jgi:hypothetical protein
MKLILQQSQIQMRFKAAVKNVLQQLDADVYTVQEISDDILFAQMVSEMNDYSCLSEYFNLSVLDPNSLFIKNKTVEPVQTKCFYKLFILIITVEMHLLVNYQMIKPFFLEAEDYLYANSECYY